MHVFCLLVRRRPSLAQLRSFKVRNGTVDVISCLASSEWRKFGAILDLDNDGNKLTTIEAKHPFDPEACVTELLQFWLKGNGSVQPCTWMALIGLLKECNCKFTAEQIQNAL